LEDGEERYAAGDSNDQRDAGRGQWHREEQKGHAPDHPHGIPCRDGENEVGTTGGSASHPSDERSEHEEADPDAAEDVLREPAHRIPN
jgi:hypothetical protein